MSEFFFAHSLLKITNPTIISFYQSNPHIEFEAGNILLVDILQKSGSIKPLETIIIQVEHKT
jgi:hypothetical protein